MHDDRLISIRGARTHNLKGIDIDLPRHRMIAICGVSGSGKSSLAFDTLYAEGQRRYVESLSAYARQFLDQITKPDVDRIDGLSPAIAIDQRAATPNPRSTIATLTEIHDYLRLLYTTLGTPHDPATGAPLRRLTTPDIARALLALPEGTRIILLSPIEERERLDDPVALRDHLKRQGFVRVRLGGAIIDLDEMPTGKIKATTKVEIVIDRLVAKYGMDARLADSIETARRWSPHRVLATVQPPGATDPVVEVFPTSFTNPDTGFTLPEPTPKHFSFNSPQGACPDCHGVGKVAREDGRNVKMLGLTPCGGCGGRRLLPWVLAVTLGDGDAALSIDRWCAQTVDQAAEWVAGFAVASHQEVFAVPLVAEIRQRLAFMREVGLGYLTLDREAATLSGGEFQRIRLATQIGSGLSGVLYVLDEPSIGLHPQDHRRLLDSLRNLQALGNTVVVVEHDEETLHAADHIVDIGPGAGHLGGELLFSGTLAALLADPAAAPRSLTRAYLTGERAIRPPSPRVEPRPRAAGDPAASGWLVMRGATGNNLRTVDMRLPLGCLVAIAGVSGSGKSSLVMDTLCPALNILLNRGQGNPLPHAGIDGAGQLDKLIPIDQSPIGRSHRSNPATFTGAFDLIRALFAKTPAARTRGFGPSRFSFNRPGGRCEACQGEGSMRINMHFLADVHAPCEACAGKRFNRETLEVTFKGRNISQVLDMTIDEACTFFGAVSDVARRLESLRRAGLGYLRLGQPADTLSGGEAQRLKLAAELARKAGPRTLYLLDEPTTGLHFADIQVLLDNLFALRNHGHTVVVVEHQIDVLRCADWVIELGPGGGPDGGTIIAEGTPDELATMDTPTGRFLGRRGRIG